MTSLRTLRSTTSRVVAPVAAAAIALVTFAGTASAASVDPVFVEGNPSCPAGTTEHKIDAEPAVKGYTIGDFTVDITKSADGTVSFANASKDVVTVIVKGGPNANVYRYDPAVRADDDLVTPTNPNNDKRYGTSHVTFCSGTTTPPQDQNTPTPETPAGDTPAPQDPAPAVVAAVQTTPAPAAPAAAQVLGVQVEREAAPQVLGAQLAATGIDTTTMAVVGITLVGIGAALLPVTRRRRTSDAG